MAKQEKKAIHPGAFFIATAILSLVLWAVFGRPLTDALIVWRGMLLEPLAGVSGDTATLLGKLYRVDPKNVTFAGFMEIAQKTGEPIRWFAVVPLGLLTIYVFLKAPMASFAKRHTMKTLAEQESKLWPEITPSLKANLLEGDISKGPWAAMMTEWEFSRRFDLINPETRDLDREKAKEVFIRQLGDMWRGPEYLPKHTQALFAAFALKIMGESDQCNARLDDLSRTFDAKTHIDGTDLSWVMPTIERAMKNKIVIESIRRHAYVFTVIATMLRVARVEGVLASAKFIWLRPVDRRLWYTLNGVGRYAFPVECAGIMAHWRAERAMQQKMLAPMVEAAINGLDEALRQYKEEDEIERIFK